MFTSVITIVLVLLLPISAIFISSSFARYVQAYNQPSTTVTTSLSRSTERVDQNLTLHGVIDYKGDSLRDLGVGCCKLRGRTILCSRSRESVKEREKERECNVDCPTVSRRNCTSITVDGLVLG